MSVIVKKPGEPPQIVPLTKPTLKFLQGAVGGYVEKVTAIDFPDGGGVDIWCNEDGLSLGLEHNLFVLTPACGEVHFVGPIVIAGFSADGDTLDLPDDQITHWMVAFGLEAWWRKRGVEEECGQ